MSDSLDSLPEDATEQAKLVKDPAVLPLRKERAWTELQIVIERVLGRLRNRFSQRMHDELAVDAASWIFLKIDKYDPSVTKFENWCYKVLRNRGTDLARSENRASRPTSIENVDDCPDGDHGINLDQMEKQDEFMAPFSQKDIATIECWEDDRLLVVLVLSGLWHKVPHELWHMLVLRHGLPWPFPPCGFVEIDPEDMGERQRMLADCLGVPAGNVSQWLCRLKYRLRELVFVGEYAP